MEIKESTFKDIKAGVGGDIFDIAPEAFIKVYPYRMINSTRIKDTFLQNNTYSIIRINNSGYTLTKDGSNINQYGALESIDNKYYFEGFPIAINDQVVIDNQSNTSQYTKELGNEVSYTLSVSNNYKYEPNEDDYIKVYFIGKPFDPADKKQRAYISTEITGYNPEEGESLVQIRLVDMNVVKTQFKNNRVSFIEVNTDNMDISKIQVGLDTNCLFGETNIKRYNNDIDNDDVEIKKVETVELDIDVSIPVILATPNENYQNQLYMYMHWLDYKKTMPLWLAERFKNGGKLVDMFKVSTGGAWIDGGELLFDLLVNMLTYTHMMLNDFSDVDHGDKDWDATSLSFAKYKPNVFIGTELKGSTVVSGLKGQSRSITEVNGVIGSKVYELFTTFKRVNPNINASSYLIFRGIVAAMSKSIICDNLTIGSQETSLGDFILPWNIKLDSLANDTVPFKIISGVQTITGKDVPANTALHFYSIQKPEDITISITTSWYDVNLNPKKVGDITNLKVIDSEYNIVQAPIPPTLQPLNFSTNIGDTDLKGNTSVKYLWHINNSNDGLYDALFSKTQTHTTGTTTPAPYNITVNDVGKLNDILTHFHNNPDTFSKGNLKLYGGWKAPQGSDIFTNISAFSGGIDWTKTDWIIDPIFTQSKMLDLILYLEDLDGSNYNESTAKIELEKFYNALKAGVSTTGVEKHSAFNDHGYNGNNLIFGNTRTIQDVLQDGVYDTEIAYDGTKRSKDEIYNYLAGKYTFNDHDGPRIYLTIDDIKYFYPSWTIDNTLIGKNYLDWHYTNGVYNHIQSNIAFNRVVTLHTTNVFLAQNKPSIVSHFDWEKKKVQYTKFEWLNKLNDIHKNETLHYAPLIEKGMTASDTIKAKEINGISLWNNQISLVFNDSQNKQQVFTFRHYNEEDETDVQWKIVFA